MANYITIDGGTTNTRVSLVIDGEVTDTLRFNVGARNGIDNKTVLKETLKKGIAEILEKNNITGNSITRILASGMITSEFGLVDLKHILAPAGISELHSTMYETVLDDISQIPFCFVRGVKTNCETFENAEMMRGEETELMGLSGEGAGVYILPGSHTKIIEIDSDGSIVDFKTMLTGEMITALSQNTILKSAVSLETSGFNEEYLLKGYHYCSQNGINDALFKVRILKNLYGNYDDEIYSFFMGVMLCNEVKYVLSKEPGKIVIAGKKQIKECLSALLRSVSDVQIIEISEQESSCAQSLGIVKIFEFQK